MGIEKFIQKVCVQTAVYWGNPQDDGYGGKIYDDGVEIACRWQDIGHDVINTSDGKTYTSKTQVLVTQDVDVEGYLYLGTLADLDAVGLNKLITDFRPAEMNKAYMIRKFEKIPLIKSSTKFVRTAYL